MLQHDKEGIYKANVLEIPKVEFFENSTRKVKGSIVSDIIFTFSSLGTLF